MWEGADRCPMIFAQTSLFYLLGLSLAFLCGYGVLRYLLPDDLQEYRFAIAVPCGCSVFVWTAFTVSAAFSIVVAKALWISLATLSAISVAAFFTMHPRESWKDLGKGAGAIGLLSATMVLFALWPFFYIGADTYLGAVNPDFTFAFKDQYYTKNHVATSSGSPVDTYAPFEFRAARTPVQARYRGVIFANLLEDLCSLKGRTALTLALAIWMTAVPGSIYFASRVAFGLDLMASRIAAVLCGISGAIAMSGFLFFVGQNSTLAMTPVLLTVFYVLMTRPSPGIFWLSSLLFCSVFWMYPVMMPYAIGPIAGMSVYLIATRRLKLTAALSIGFGLGGIFLLSVLPFAGFLPGYFVGWQDLLLHHLNWGRYLAEFRTERFAFYFMGLAPYPLEGSLAARWLGTYAVPVLGVCGTLVAAGFFVALWDWSRHQAERQRVALVAAVGVLIAGAWWQLTFRQQYGYGLLKLVSWVQFSVMPIGAYGVARLWRLIRRPNGVPRGGLKMAILTGIALCWIGGNVLSTLEYGQRGAVQWKRADGVATPGVSGNYDYLDLERAVPPMIRPRESVGLAFSDSIQTEWATYYLRRVRLSILSHVWLPLVEEYVADASRPTGQQPVPAYDNDFFHGATDDYYLTANKDGPTRDIIDQQLPAPVWRDRTFQLIKADEAEDFMVTGRGFYPTEEAPERRSYWWPERFRWSAEGGELYIFRPSAKGQPYRLSLVLLSGYGLNSARRTVEFYRGTSLFDVVTINGNARVLSRTFVPVGDFERIVFSIRERTDFVPRRFAIWNPSIPNDVRHLNVAVAEVRLVTPGHLRQSAGLGELVRGQDVFRRALAFDGIEGDGWFREAGTMCFVAPPGSSRVRLTLLVPKIDSFKFPYAISFDIDGHKVEVVIRRPGWVVFGFPLPRSRDSRVTTLNVRPSQAFKPSGYDHGLRPVLQSVRFESVIFDSTAQPQPSCSDCVAISGDDLGPRGGVTSGRAGKE
jgi:hypothetical protein